METFRCPECGTLLPVNADLCLMCGVRVKYEPLTDPNLRSLDRKYHETSMSTSNDRILEDGVESP